MVSNAEARRKGVAGVLTGGKRIGSAIKACS